MFQSAQCVLSMPPPPEAPVTILAALVEGDTSIVLAADSYEERFNPELRIYLWEPVDKFQCRKFGNAFLAWGYAGSGAGDSFSENIGSLSMGTWEEFQEGVRGNVRAINEPLWPDLNKTVDLVVAGYINGEQRVIGVTPWGDLHQPVGNALFVGRGGPEVGVPIWTDLLTRGGSETPAALKKTLDSFVDRVTGLKGPIRRWRLTPNDFQEI